MINVGSKVVYVGRSGKNAKILKGIVGEVTSHPTKDRVNAIFKVPNPKAETVDEHHIFCEPTALATLNRLPGN